MPTPDQEFINKLRATFKVEAAEHLQAISAMLLELEKAASAEQVATLTENVYREAHSLKGAARAVDLSEIEEICQALEGVFSAWKRQHKQPPAEAFDTLHIAADAVRALLGSREARQRGNDKIQFDELIHLLNNLQTSVPAPGNAGVNRPAANLPSAPAALSSTHQTSVTEGVADETVRISIAKLDAQLLQAEDMLSVKAMIAQRALELRALRTLFEQWRHDWSKACLEARTSGPRSEKRQDAGEQTAVAPGLDFMDWHSDYFRSVGNRLTSLAAQAEQDRHGVAKRVDELLEDSKKLLMLPFSTLADIFPKVTRDLCRDQDKDADLVIRGGEVEIDKRILEEMKDAFIHILRNCVDHGIEKRGRRAELNKPDRAVITIAVAPINGSKVEIVVSDDGGGVDVEKVKSSAVRQGIISETEARSLSDADALALIFHSEVSTSPIVTAISGRGLGMAIVQAKVEKLGGRVSIESKPGVGTTLRMVLPLTLATFRGILVAAGDHIFVAPIVNVERVLRVKPQDIKTVENRETISLHGRTVSFARLATVLDLRLKPKRTGDEAPLSVIVLNSADQRVAFAVDEVLHEEEVLVKPLRKPLVRVRNVGGVTVLGSGRVVPILNVADLIKSARKDGGAPGRAPSPAVDPAARKRNVLVVEDSVTSRMLLKGILESAGYQVKTAVDGVEAYATLREGEFDLVVSDVEMPRMNGFDLTVKVRADKRLANLPVVLVTALESRDQRERGIDAGANAYIVKSSFDQSNLLEVLHRLI